MIAKNWQHEYLNFIKSGHEKETQNFEIRARTGNNRTEYRNITYTVTRMNSNA